MKSIKKYHEEFINNTEGISSNDNEAVLHIFFNRIENTETANLEMKSICSGSQMYDMLKALIDHKPMLIPMLLEIINNKITQTKEMQPPLMGQGGEA